MQTTPQSKQQRWFRWSFVGAISSLILATACCWLPLLLIVAGIGGVGLASTLAVYRPFFYGLAFVALGLAFYLTYRKPDKAAEECCTVEEGQPPTLQERVRRFNKIALWPLAGLVILSLFIPRWTDAYLIQKQAETDSAVPSSAVTRVQFIVTNMDCAACAAGVEAALKAMPGVIDARVKYPEGNAYVVLKSRPDPAFRDTLADKIKSMGYGVRFPEAPKQVTQKNNAQ